MTAQTAGEPLHPPRADEPLHPWYRRLLAPLLDFLVDFEKSWVGTSLLLASMARGTLPVASGLGRGVNRGRLHCPDA